MHFPWARVATAARGFAVLALASHLAACVLTLPESADTLYPRFLAVEAGCDSEDLWVLTASLSQESGDSTAIAVWAEVELLTLDEWGQLAFQDYLGLIPLELMETAYWGIQLHPDETFLDCQAPGEYLFHFYAEDSEGNLAGIDLLN